MQHITILQVKFYLKQKEKKSNTHIKNKKNMKHKTN